MVTSSAEATANTSALSGVLVASDIVGRDTGSGDCASDVAVTQLTSVGVGRRQVESVTATTVARCTFHVRLAWTVTGDLVAINSGRRV